ncbi:hypothetical protein HK096_001187 [Nowakowskiella sp. JEL0078]|nr:hypothetical protein HK096_001187 [Nowakowskiella sp. JEL0078]
MSTPTSPQSPKKKESVVYHNEYPALAETSASRKNSTASNNGAWKKKDSISAASDSSDISQRKKHSTASNISTLSDVAHPPSIEPILSTLSADEKFEFITRNLQEVLQPDLIKSILAERDLKLYWGTAPTGKPHIGYFVPMTKIADFLKAGCEVTVLLADLHAFLDNMKSDWDLLKFRTRYYERVIKAMLKSIGVPIEKLKFVVGTDYQLSREYCLDSYRLAAIVTERDAKKAGAEVVKQVESALLSGLIYPGLQALDEEYLKVDAQFGGVDQRKIFVYAEKYLPELGYKKRAHLMNVMVGGLSGTKMSSSDQNSKVDLLEDAKSVEKKLKQAFCEEGNIEVNPILALTKIVIFPTLSLSSDTPKFKISRSEKFGGDIVFDNYQAVEDAFARKELHPGDLKKGVIDAFNSLLEPIRQQFTSREDLELVNSAYPPGPDDISKLDIRVGKVLEFSVEGEYIVVTVDIGKEEPRKIVLPYGKSISPASLSKKNVVVITNTKPSKIGAHVSHGNILLASTADKSSMRVIDPLSSCKPGDLITIAGFPSTPEAQIAPKQKILEKCLPHIKIEVDDVITYKGLSLNAGSGNIKVKGMTGSSISV